MKLNLLTSLAVIAALTMAGCSSRSEDPSASQALGDSKQGNGDSVTQNFAKVSDVLYRGARPDFEAIRTLKTQYGIKTIVSLEMTDYIEASPKVVEEEQANAERLGVRFVHLPFTSFDPALRSGFDARIDEIQAALGTPSLQPVYVHCRRGKDRTGLVVALNRVEQQGWEPKKAHDEMLAMGFFRFFQNLDVYFKLRTGWHDEDD